MAGNGNELKLGRGLEETENKKLYLFLHNFLLFLWLFRSGSTVDESGRSVLLAAVAVAVVFFFTFFFLTGSPVLGGGSPIGISCSVVGLLGKQRGKS